MLWGYPRAGRELQGLIAGDRSHRICMRGLGDGSSAVSLCWFSCLGVDFLVGFSKDRAWLLILNNYMYFSYSEASTSCVPSPKGCACGQDGHAALPGAGGLPAAALQLVPQRRAAAHGFQNQPQIPKLLFPPQLSDRHSGKIPSER